MEKSQPGKRGNKVIVTKQEEKFRRKSQALDGNFYNDCMRKKRKRSLEREETKLC